MLIVHLQLVAKYSKTLLMWLLILVGDQWECCATSLMAWKFMKSRSARRADAMHGMCFDTRWCTKHCRASEDGKAQLFHAVISGCIPVDAAAWTAASAVASAEPAAAEGAAAAEEVLWPFVPKAIRSRHR